MLNHLRQDKNKKREGQVLRIKVKIKRGKNSASFREGRTETAIIIPFRVKGNTMESVFQVAAYILSKESMNHKKLQKLCFYSQSWYYAFENELLFDEPFEAWIHGPVCPILYKAYKQWGSLDIPRFEKTETLELTERSKEIIDSVYAAYGKFSADILEACTHEEYPWKNARKGYESDENCRAIISNDEMKQVCLDKINEA